MFRMVNASTSRDQQLSLVASALSITIAHSPFFSSKMSSGTTLGSIQLTGVLSAKPHEVLCADRVTKRRIWTGRVRDTDHYSWRPLTTHHLLNRRNRSMIAGMVSISTSSQISNGLLSKRSFRDTTHLLRSTSSAMSAGMVGLKLAMVGWEINAMFSL